MQEKQLNITKKTRPRLIMPRPSMFKSKKTYDRQMQKQNLRKTLQEE